MHVYVHACPVRLQQKIALHFSEVMTGYTALRLRLVSAQYYYLCSRITSWAFIHRLRPPMSVCNKASKAWCELSHNLHKF